MKTGTTEEHHRTRIVAKNLRYGAEFFQSLYSSRSARRYLRRLTALQNKLGALNDVAFADEWLRQIEPNNPELSAGASFARGYLSASVPPDRRAIDKIWGKFSKVTLS